MLPDWTLIAVIETKEGKEEGKEGWKKEGMEGGTQ